jgi:hypothetical protein
MFEALNVCAIVTYDADNVGVLKYEAGVVRQIISLFKSYYGNDEVLGIECLA